MNTEELKRLALDAKRLCTLNGKLISWYEHTDLLDQDTDDAVYIAAASPDVVLDLIAERDAWEENCNEQVTLLNQIANERDEILVKAQREFWEACKAYGKVGEVVYLTYKSRMK